MDIVTGFVAAIVAIGGLVWAIIAHKQIQGRNLALERTKFVFEQSRYFDTDPQMQTANKILYGISPFTVDAFLHIMKSKIGTEEEIDQAMALKKLLNFLWRITYAFLYLKTISIEDLTAFGNVLYKVQSHASLRDYCVENGFEEIIEATEKLEDIWKHWEFVRKDRALRNNEVEVTAYRQMTEGQIE